MSKSDTAPQIPLSRERILITAIHLADKSGLESLSMRKIAQELGVQAMSLYNHVANKDDLLDGIIDIVIGEIEVPNLGVDWQTAMRRRANSAHEVLLRHPWATTPIVSRINIGPAMLRYIDATLGCLCEAGFSFEMVDRAWNAIDSHIYGFTLQELNFPIKTTEYAKAAQEYIPNIPADKYPYMNRLTYYIIDGYYDGIVDFNFGLELILDGLDKLRCRY
jgi:Tetracyclin repressor-like, C-terminal domain/Bacterial regulatory proteins, tetR family